MIQTYINITLIVVGILYIGQFCRSCKYCGIIKIHFPRMVGIVCCGSAVVVCVECFRYVL